MRWCPGPWWPAEHTRRITGPCLKTVCLLLFLLLFFHNISMNFIKKLIHRWKCCLLACQLTHYIHMLANWLIFKNNPSDADYSIWAIKKTHQICKSLQTHIWGPTNHVIMTIYNCWFFHPNNGGKKLLKFSNIID